MEALRINLLLPLYHEFIQAKYFEELQCRFANVVLALKPEAGKVWLFPGGFSLCFVMCEIILPVLRCVVGQATHVLP